MRGRDDRSDGLFFYVRLEERVPADHPLRPIRTLADEVLAALNQRFEALYSSMGRPSIPPEMLLRATLLQAFFSVRSERLLMEQINYNLLFRWFVGLPLDGAVWHPTVFTHNRDRLLEAEVARDFLSALLALPRVKKLLSDEHFSVDGTLIDAWASMKSFRPKSLSSGEDPRTGSGSPPGPGRNGERNFRKEKRSNESHASTTDPDARLYRKAEGRESRLCFMGHVLMENRNGLAVDAALTRATGTAEREAALAMLDRRPRGGRVTHGTDKAGACPWAGRRPDPRDVTAFVEDLRDRTVTPHVAVNGAVSKRGVVRKTAVDGRTTHHAGYAISQIVRKRIEEVFGWVKAQAGLAKVKVRGCPKAEAVFTFAVAAYNLIRIPKLLAQASP
jgi:transposase